MSTGEDDLDLVDLVASDEGKEGVPDGTGEGDEPDAQDTPTEPQEPEEPEGEPGGESGDTDVEEPDEGEPCGEGGEPCGAPERPFLEYIAQNYGEEIANALGQKYATDEELVKGLLEAQKLVGRREHRSRMFDKLVERFGEEAVAEMVASGKIPDTVKQEPTEPKKSEDDKDDLQPPEFDPSWYYKVKLNPTTGKWEALPGEDDTIPAKLDRWIKYREALIDAFAKDPKRFITTLVGDWREQWQAFIDDFNKRAQEYADQAKNLNYLAATVQANKEVLFVDGDPQKGPTEFGEKFVEHLNNLAGKVTDEKLRVELALKLARADLAPKGGAKRPLKKTATRATSAGGQRKKPSVDDLVDQGMDLVEAFRRAGEL